MSDTAAAIRAAKEVEADIRAPELFQQAREWFERAKREYKFKNFKEAQEYASKARGFAEEAELSSVTGGASRSNLADTPEEAGSESESIPPENPPADDESRQDGVYIEYMNEQKEKQKSEANPQTSPPPPPGR